MNSWPTRSAKLIRARTAEVELREAGADGGTGLGAGDTLGARDSLGRGDAEDEAGTAARDDPRGDGWTGDSGRPAGAEQAELSMTTKVSPPNRAHFKSTPSLRERQAAVPQGLGPGHLAAHSGAATSRWHRYCVPTLDRTTHRRALVFIDRQNRLI